ncbi:MAG: hypothetical protein JSV17_07540 [Candidatus Aminicenantes bacterium]|nr:MAG: hypothetical protein JSV17_07540 [Candidatus Aminicenantes bacterium]
MKKLSLFLMIPMAISLLPKSGFTGIQLGVGEIKGYMVGEYYWIVNHHGETVKGRHGFWFRRIYFTYDNKLSEVVKVRLRLEMASAPKFETYALLTPWVKDAYIDFKIASLDLIAGIMSPPSFAQVEEIWGYRVLEKTPLDLHRWTSSRDFGISLRGGKTLPFQIMYANGSSNKSETNRGKKFYGALGYSKNGFFIEAMAQFEKTRNDYAEYIFQGFGGYSGDWGRVGLQYAFRNSKHVDEEDSFKYNVISVFAVIYAGKNIELIGRFDKYFGEGYKTNYSGSLVDYIPFAENAESNFFIGAFSYQIHKDVWLIPNVKYVYYTEMEEDVTPSSDAYINLTLWFKF